MCRSLHFAFSLTRTLSRSFQSVTAKNRKEVLAARTYYRKEVLALLSCNHKEVLVVSRTQAQATRNQPQEELFLPDTKRSSCVCIIFGLYFKFCNYFIHSFFFHSINLLFDSILPLPLLSKKRLKIESFELFVVFHSQHELLYLTLKCYSSIPF